MGLSDALASFVGTQTAGIRRAQHLPTRAQHVEHRVYAQPVVKVDKAPVKSPKRNPTSSERWRGRDHKKNTNLRDAASGLMSGVHAINNLGDGASDAYTLGLTKWIDEQMGRGEREEDSYAYKAGVPIGILAGAPTFAAGKSLRGIPAFAKWAPRGAGPNVFPHGDRQLALAHKTLREIAKRNAAEATEEVAPKAAKAAKRNPIEMPELPIPAGWTSRTIR